MSSKFILATRCVEANGDDITEMVDSARQITIETFKRHCNWRPIAARLGYNTAPRAKSGLRIETDPYVSFFKSVYRGHPCYYMDWSRIEHVFLAKGVVPE